MKLSKRRISISASLLNWACPSLQASELAAKEKLPLKFLEQIFMQLKAADYVSPPAHREGCPASE